MRTIISLYLFIGIVLLALGHLVTGECSKRNLDPVNNVVFVLAWPVYLYGDVIEKGMTPANWLHRQACEEGGVSGKTGADLPSAKPQ